MSIVCISHKEDADGICSATIIKAAFAESLETITSSSSASSSSSSATSSTTTIAVILVDYAHLIARLEKVINDESPRIEKLFICDLGLSKKNERQFVELLGKAVTAGADVTYIDHHDINKETMQSIKKAGVTVVHTINECTSVQAYNKYKKKLPDHALFFAAMGALTDYMEDRPVAATIVPRFDRQFLMLESTALSYMISANQHNDQFLLKIVDTLAKMKYPHDIKGGFGIAEKYAKKVSKAAEAIRESIVKLQNLAHAPSAVDLSSSMVVNFVLGASVKPVAMVYKLKQDINCYVISIRGSAECKIHLGRLVNDIASGLGGSGGGHDKACGAVIPGDKLEEFIITMDKSLSE
jgi:RecJ-like exonuclease